MHEISIVQLDADSAQIGPLIEKLGGHICAVYSKRARRNVFRDSNDKRYVTSYLPGLARILCVLLSRLKIVPEYYTYLLQHKAMDLLFAKRVANDKSSIVYAHCSYLKTIKKAKQKGKIVVTMAGNSEPIRENRRVLEDYNHFGIKNRYIYGNTKYESIIKSSILLADRVISISKVSLATYVNAGYDASSFHLIPLTGTDFPVKSVASPKGKTKAFITTAYHNFVKGTHRLLLAWQKANINDIPLIVVGRLCEDMQEFIEIFGPFNNVIYVGHQRNVREFYNNYDAVGILFSLSEGAGRVTPEMMSFGFPMIVSPDATCDIVEDGRNGYIVDTMNEEGLIERLKWFADDWQRVYDIRPNVLSSVSSRTIKDFSLDCADFLENLI